jgi:putative transposase
MAKVEFYNNGIFHLYNRGIDKRIVFSYQKDYIRFLEHLWYFNISVPLRSLYKHKELLQKMYENRGAAPRAGGVAPRREGGSLVKILAYCLLPNHFHLIVKQLTDQGVSKFMQKVSGGYTEYFNYNNERSGSLFQGKFKSVHVGSPDHLLWLSAYVNGNAEIHGYKRCDDWPWSSYLDYIGERNGQLCCREELFRWSEFSGDSKEYRELVQSAIAESKHRKESIKNELKQKILE